MLCLGQGFKLLTANHQALMKLVKTVKMNEMKKKAPVVCKPTKGKMPVYGPLLVVQACVYPKISIDDYNVISCI